MRQATAKARPANGQAPQAAAAAAASADRQDRTAEASTSGEISGTPGFHNMGLDDRILVTILPCLQSREWIVPSVTTATEGPQSRPAPKSSNNYGDSPPPYKTLYQLSACYRCGVPAMSTLQGNLQSMGIHEPTEVQQQAIPAMLEGRNIAIQSYTGSGKVPSRPCQGCSERLPGDLK